MNPFDKVRNTPIDEDLEAGKNQSSTTSAAERDYTPPPKARTSADEREAAVRSRRGGYADRALWPRVPGDDPG